MPPKKPSIFNVTSEEPKKQKLPTLRQWLKEQKADDFKQFHQIRVIWLPGQWKNFTLETTCFRAQVTEYNPLYAALSSDLDSFTREGGDILLRIVDRQRLTFSLLPGEGDGEWFFIGDSGLRYEGSVVESY